MVTTKLKVAIKQWPLSAFIFIAFLISYVIGIPFNAFVSGTISNGSEIAKTYFPIVITAWGPGIAAIILTRILRKNSGSFLPWTLLKPVKTSLIPAACCVLIAFGLSFGVFAVIADLPVRTVILMVSNNWQLLFLHLAAQFFIVGIGEELGWRGWMLTHLARRNSLIRSTFLIFIAWTLWHVPKVFQESTLSISFVMIFFALSVIFTWMWVKLKGNLFAVVMAHAAVNTPIFFLESRIATYGVEVDSLLLTWKFLCLIYFAASIFIVAHHFLWKRPFFSRQPIHKERRL